MITLLLLACSPGTITVDKTDPVDTGLDQVDDSGDSATDSGDSATDSGDSGDSGDDSGDSGDVPCDEDASLSVVGVDYSQPWGPNEIAIDVTLSGKASVAVECTLDGDATEVMLAEDDNAAATHTLRMAGLLASSTYNCRVAPTCPTQAGPSAHFTVETGRAPDHTPGLTTHSYGEDVGGYILLNVSDDCSRDWQLLTVVDRQGRQRWSWETPAYVGPSVEFRYEGDDNFEWGGGWDPNPLGPPQIVNIYDGVTYSTEDALPDAATTMFTHDGKRIADGRFATLEQVDVSTGRNTLDGFQVRIVNPSTNRVEYTYDSQRGMDEGHLPSGRGDAWHANWVDVVTEGSQTDVLVSLCAAERVVDFDGVTGDWRWTFGADGDFSLKDADGRTLGDDEFPQCQHGLERVGDKLLVYDNGWSRGYSRASEYTLDTTNMSAVLNWTWTESDWWETSMGDVDYLPDGHVMVTEAHGECFSSNHGDTTTLVEMDPVSGDKLWQLTYDDIGTMAYRSDWADGCDLFANAAVCPTVAARVESLAPLFAE